MNHMYPNLEAEMEKRGLKRKDLARLFNNRAATVSDKLNGKSPMYLDDAFKIKNTHFPDLPVDYLFNKKDQGTA